MRIIREQVKEQYQLYNAIKCFDCNALVSKGQLKRHMGHDVHYIGKDGEMDD